MFCRLPSKLVVSAALGTLLVFSAHVQAIVLSVKNRSVDIQFGDNRVYNGEADYSLGAYATLSGNPPLLATPIPSTHISAASVGTTFAFDAVNSSPDFLKVASIMVDGVAQFGKSSFFLNATGGGADAGDGGQLKNYFGSQPTSAPDWAGNSLIITGTSFRLDSFDLSAGTPVNGVIPYHFTAGYTLTLEGEYVPEPTGALAAIGVLIAYATSRRRVARA